MGTKLNFASIEREEREYFIEEYTKEVDRLIMESFNIKPVIIDKRKRKDWRGDIK